MQSRSDVDAIFSLPLERQHFLSFNDQNAEAVGADYSAVRQEGPILSNGWHNPQHMPQHLLLFLHE